MYVKMMNNSIDAVITWVDGTETHYAEKLKHWLPEKIVRSAGADAAHPTRFNQCGELYYCLQTIARFAPWIGRIFIVTDNQIPQFPTPLPESLEAKITLVSHQEIFSGFEEVLPVFNSLSIETMLWRIPDLSEQFIYFNDDCFLIDYVTPEDFFYEDKPVLRGKWKVQSRYKLSMVIARLMERVLPVRICPPAFHRIVQENSAILAGWQYIFFHLPHIPFPNLKSTWAEYFAGHPEKLAANCKYRIRDEAQFWPLSLIQQYTIKNFGAVIDPVLQAVTINGAHRNQAAVVKALRRADEDERTKFLCLQSMDITAPATREIMFAWLRQKLR